VAIRVMLGKMPALLRDILGETLAGQRDIMLVGSPDSAVPLSMSVAEHQPHVLVVAIDKPDVVSNVVELFLENPSLRVLAIGEDARSATMHELYFRRWRVAELSPGAIVDAVRALHAVESSFDTAPPEPRR
jgi:hypothetical protein